MSDQTESAQLTPELKAELDSLFDQFRERHRIPGMAFGVVVQGELDHLGVSGWSNLEGEVPVREGTVFRIASMTKSITACCVLMLRDDGLIELDQPVERFVPEVRQWTAPTQDSPKVTVRQLLTMSAGLMEDDPWADRQLAMEGQAFGRLLAQGVPFNRPPGVGFEYSNLGYALLGRVVAEVSGQPLSTLATTRLFQPLGMTSTTWDVRQVPDQLRARGYRRSGDLWEEEAPLGPGAFGPMGGVWTSIPDFARYVAFQLAAWPPRDDPDPGPLRRSSAREMQQLKVPSRLSRPLREGVSGLGYGYGLLSGQHPKQGLVACHSGGLPGFGSHVQWLPDCGVGLIAFANLTYSPAGAAVAEAIEALDAAEFLQPRAIPLAPALVAAREAAIRLYQEGDGSQLGAMAADNLFLDRSAEERQREFHELLQAWGPCLDQGPLLAEGTLRASWRMTCARGELEGRVWLAPTPGPPRVQMLSLQPA